MNNYFQFKPDLIVEATAVCDRACTGCYAPNLISKKPHETFLARPELFLSPDLVRTTLNEFREKSLKQISIRGGEPTLHPEIISILRSCGEYADLVLLETHGRWLFPESRQLHEALIASLTDARLAIKLSFDKMHGLSVEQLKIISEFLFEKKIDFFVAITEIDLETFMTTRLRCEFISDEKIIFQQKVSLAKDLIRPNFGVLSVHGRISTQLNSKFESKSASAALSERAI